MEPPYAAFCVCTLSIDGSSGTSTSVNCSLSFAKPAGTHDELNKVRLDATVTQRQLIPSLCTPGPQSSCHDADLRCLGHIVCPDKLLRLLTSLSLARSSRNMHEVESDALSFHSRLFRAMYGIAVSIIEMDQKEKYWFILSSLRGGTTIWSMQGTEQVLSPHVFHFITTF